MEESRRFSVVIVCYNEKNNIGPCIDSLLEQDYPDKNYEILIVDGGSKDGTRDIVGAYTKSPNLRLVDNPERKISNGRNAGIRAAKYDYVAFTDADCIVPKEWLKKINAGWLRYNGKEIAALGGANIPPAEEGSFVQAAGIVLKTFLGNHGSAQGKIFKKDSFIEHIPTVNICYKKDVLFEMNGFDESYGNICEDPELNYRITLAGYKFVFLKGLFIYHRMRASLSAWQRMVFTYGKGRMWIIAKHPQHFSLKFALPVFFLPVMASTVLFSFNFLFLLPLLYFPIIFIISCFEGIRNRRAALIPLIFAIYTVTHFSYGIGEIYGIFNPRTKFNKPGRLRTNE